MRVRFFIDNMLQQMYDGVQVQFISSPDLPDPAYEFILDHFRQAVLANMKGGGKVQIYDIDPTEDAQNMSVFENGEGKEYMEAFMREKLLSQETIRDNNAKISS